jgi:diguanylate cyclase (GGDEF)-like protein
MDGSVVDHSFRAARRTVVAAFSVSLVIIIVLVAERFAFERDILAAGEGARSATRLNGDVLLADERLTMSANMAAATGEERWIARYDEYIPAIDGAIAEAKKLAPPEVSRAFDAATRAANDMLVLMERRSFELVRSGRLKDARAILDGSEYASQKDILAAGSGRFALELLGSQQRNLDWVSKRSMWIVASLLALALTGFFLLWRHLNRSLVASKGYFLDAERQVHRLALHDPLTGLPNRRYFHQELQRLMNEGTASRARTAVIMLDLDRFKPINDRLGHAAGDFVLVEIGRSLADALSLGCFCARVGGDEFAVALSLTGDDEEARRMASRIVERLSAPVEIDGIAHKIGATAGIAITPDDATEIGELVRKADVALCHAKRRHRGAVCTFEDAMDEEIRALAEVEADLRQAIDRGEIEPYFQPVVNLADGELEYFEVLARWNHPARGVLLPASFIPAAEQLDLIHDVFGTILRQACRAAKTWPSAISIAVNVAPQQLSRPHFAEGVLGILAETGFPARRLEIELTESALIANLQQTVAAVTSLKNQGVRLALDDFGAGHSSLHHLRSLPFDRLKIDGSFVKTMASDPEAAKIVQVISTLGRALGLKTTGEWVESADVRTALAAAGCASGQGYHLGKPMPAQEAAQLLAPERQRQLAS